MSDIVDAAHNEEYIITQALVSNPRAYHKLTSVGYCHYCDEPVEQPKLFCNGTCADHFDKHN